MIMIYTNRMDFEYDIHSLVKAFFPTKALKVVSMDAPVILDPKDQEEEWSIHITIEENLLSCIFPNQENSVRIEENALRSDVKNILKRVLYQSLAEYTQTQLPWGTLTGIRPTKIPMTLLEQEMSESEILDYMKETYYISEEKGKLSIQIAKREKEILSPLHLKDGYSLYIGIPFCPTTCLYCSFTSFPICNWKAKVMDYLRAVEKEIDFVAKEYQEKILDTVYIGGGTPTTLEAEELEYLLHKITTTFDFTNVIEFTVEAGRADSITRDKLEVLKRYGVNRISINPQTMKEETLKIIGRRHTVEQVKEAFFLAKEIGFDNINMDLILGLPGEEVADVQNTMDEIVKLQPDSITVHSLAVKRASKLQEWITQNGYQAMSNTDQTMNIAAQCAKTLDMQPYYLYRQKNMAGNFENVGYAKEDKYGIYNILIMEEKQTIVAIGAGTISKVVLQNGRIERCDTVKDVLLYLEKVDEMIERKRRLFQIENE